MTTTAQRQRFIELYRTDEGFHSEVDDLLWGEVADLRVALSQIAHLRREDFLTGFHYEKAVRVLADQALERLER